MNPRRRSLVTAIALASQGTLLSPLAALAQPRDYIELNPPLPVESGGKIEVTELFWYGCIHCYNLEPALESWLKKLPSDVQFRRMPAIFNNPQMALDASIFYAFEALGVLSKTKRAAQLTAAYKIDGTPAMNVQGRYTVSASDGLFNTVNALIDASRKQK